MTTDLLLCGSNGQVGWEIARRAIKSGLVCHAIDRHGLDITDREAVFRMIESIRPAVVVNAAAYTAVDKAESDVANAFAVNSDGPASLAEACAAIGSPLIHLSTDYVFDGRKTGSYGEEDLPAPLGIYGASKLAGEDAVRRLCPQHIILRTAWVFGTHGHNFVKTMLRLGRERDRLTVVDDQRGCPTFAGDLADAILILVGRLRLGQVGGDGFGTFHCAGQGSTSWCGLARKTFALAAPTLGRHPVVSAITTVEYPTTARRAANSVLNCGRLAAVHGLTLRPWEAALAEMLETLFTLKKANP